MTIAPSTPRLDALTGVRIVAALAVYASHVGPPAGAPEVVRTFFDSGYMGVTLFFTLSGFVLAVNYVDRLRRPRARAIYAYAVARFARVYPLYVLVLAYLLVRQHAAGASTEGWWQHVLAIQTWSADLGHAYNFNGPGWSIGVEFFLYACFPLIIPLVGRLRTPRAVLATGTVVVLAMLALTAWFAATGRGDLPWVDGASAHRWLYRTPLLRLGDFTLGILAATLYLQLRGQPRARRLGAPVTGLAAVLIAGLMAWPAHLNSAWSWDLSYALPSTALLLGLALAPSSLLARPLSLPVVVLLGEASYAFYLVHVPALGFLSGRRWSVDLSMTTLTYEAMTLGAILALAVGLHVLVERPARTWLRSVLAPRRRSASAMPDPPPSVAVAAGKVPTR